MKVTRLGEDGQLDAVFASKPMQVAVEHVQKELAPGLTIDEIRADVKKMWFEPFTNHYGRAQPYCVGFEHVFIGEDESNAAGAPKCEDRVGGYHSWFKFYREQPAWRGEHIRTLYPKFRGATLPVAPANGVQAGYGIDLPTQPHNEAPIRITRALPNPAAPDDAGEWVELMNVTEDTTFDLSTWRLRDQAGREKKISGDLKPGATVRNQLDRTDQNSMMLKNGEGGILLFQGDVRRAAVRYVNPPSEVLIEFGSR